MQKKKPPIPSIINKRAEIAARITKTRDSKNPRTNVDLDYNNVSAVSNSIHEKIASNEEILNLFPDVELSIQI